MNADVSLKLFELASKFIKKEEEARRFVTLIQETVEDKFDNESKNFATKQDITDVKIEIAQLRTEIKEQKAEIIKWMFIFWIGQIGVTLAILYFRG